MQPFHFRLDKVLDWRRTQLELAESRFRRERAALAELDRLSAEWEAAGIKAEAQVRKWDQLTGADLAALSEFRGCVRAAEADIALRRSERLKSLAAREAEMMGARRRCRLLERLQERRRAEWQKAESREHEALASESFLTRWSARKKPASAG